MGSSLSGPVSRRIHQAHVRLADARLAQIRVAQVRVADVRLVNHAVLHSDALQMEISQAVDRRCLPSVAENIELGVRSTVISCAESGIGRIHQRPIGIAAD